VANDRISVAYVTDQATLQRLRLLKRCFSGGTREELITLLYVTIVSWTHSYCLDSMAKKISVHRGHCFWTRNARLTGESYNC